jgi:hypothetical protein
MGSFQLREQLPLPVATMALPTEACFCGAAIQSCNTLATQTGCQKARELQLSTYPQAGQTEWASYKHQEVTSCNSGQSAGGVHLFLDVSY